MADSKGSEQKEEHLKTRTKSCQPRKTNINVERTFQEMETPLKWENKTNTKIINRQLDTKLGQITQEELSEVLRKIKNRKATGPDEIPPEKWKTRKFDDSLFRFCDLVYKQNTTERWIKAYILPFSKKGDIEIFKNYRGKNLTSAAAKVYNSQFHHTIEPEN